MTNDQNLNNNLQRNIPQRNYMNNFANLSYPMNGDIQDISFKLINNENLLFFFQTPYNWSSVQNCLYGSNNITWFSFSIHNKLNNNYLSK